MDVNVIKQLIEEGVDADHSGSLHGVDDVAEYLAAHIKSLNDKITKLESKPVEPWEDRMGGQFTQEELLEAEHNRW